MYGSLAIVSVIFLALSLYWRSWPLSYSLGLGLLIGGGNLYLITQLVKIFLGQGKGGRLRLTLLFLLKAILLLLIIGLILLEGHVRSVPFLIGISNGPLSLLLLGLSGWEMNHA
ncbi:MAG: hypothetical protein A3I75_08235 [Deltaproteobacteria bacterium RIFCSPLOWO2_02_FULL_50_16]|nr:MAG: hypothetical protein A2053_00500 [Deltaproteobacteria bacterium GWA2_50_8]OGQ28932.1 MAG: hypothetical protein A3B79_00900 [Deltaproteobacteria bacterium RIFCSPHIGHO2_02_FULL_50_15]OGQ55547.1 MAG: hypothetical protein A3I75_08235 [Deltaproteobacteria bacterium RIFCSPLOWO2_02_FULL_50_16]